MTLFFKGSRYEHVEDVEWTRPDGTVVRFKKVRLISDPPRGRGHAVTDEDRLDLLAYRYYEDSERFWVICDGNRALWPPELLERPDRIIEIPPRRA